MGLDIYVGSFTRYYCQDWQTIVQQQFSNVQVVRLSDDADDTLPDSKTVYEDVSAWRQWLNDGEVAFDWNEDPAGQYFTDKPNWDCLGSLILWAAYSAQPHLKRPEGFVEDWASDPAFLACSNAQFRGCYGVGLLTCEWWLPCELPGVAMLSDLGGREIQVGSSLDLLAELDRLNSATWRASEEQIATWSKESPEHQSALDVGARFAFAVLRQLAQKSIEHRLPMLLDY